MCLLLGPFLLYHLPGFYRSINQRGSHGMIASGVVSQGFTGHPAVQLGTDKQLVEFSDSEGRRFFEYVNLGLTGGKYLRRQFYAGESVHFFCRPGQPQSLVPINMTGLLMVSPIGMLVLGVGLTSLGLVSMLQAFYGDLTKLLLK
jgi:hypothetical protein